MTTPVAAVSSHQSHPLPSEGEETTFSTSSSQEKQNHSDKDATQNGVQVIDWDGPNDPGNPRNWSNTWKWLIAGSAILGTLLIPLNGTSITVAAGQLDKQFHISDDPFPNSYWTVTSWSIGGAVFLIVGIPLMEEIGIRLTYLCLYVFFVLMIIPQALAQNFATLIVTRFFSGGCVALLANTAANAIPDLFHDDRARSIPVSVWILCYLAGNTLGPPMFAGIMQHVGDWRWIFYVQLIIYGALFPFFWVTMKETRNNVILRRRARKLRKEKGIEIYTQDELKGRSILRHMAQAAYRPIYLQFTEPVLIASTLWSSFSFGTVFLFTQSVEQVYVGLYGWESWYVGYLQLAVVLGEILGWFATFYGTHLYFKSASRNTETPGRPIPEARLYVSIVCSFFGCGGGMFVYAWTSYPNIHWIAPTVGLVMVGFGIQAVVSAVADYVIDCYAGSNYTASAVSAVAAGEQLVAGILPLATKKIYTELGFNWASTLLGFIALLLGFAPVVFVWKGRVFRERSPFMASGGQMYASDVKS